MVQPLVFEKVFKCLLKLFDLALDLIDDFLMVIFEDERLDTRSELRHLRNLPNELLGLGKIVVLARVGLDNGDFLRSRQHVVHAFQVVMNKVFARTCS